MDKLDAAKEKTSEMTEMKKLFTTPHIPKQLKRDVTLKIKQVTWNTQ